MLQYYQLPHGNLDFLKHETKTLHPTEISIITIAVTFGPGINEVHICKPSMATPTSETNAQTTILPRYIFCKIDSSLRYSCSTSCAPVTFVTYVKVLSVISQTN